MPNHRGPTGDLELPDFEKPYRYDKSAIPCGVLFEESCGRRAVIDDTSSAFAMICAMLWHLEYCGHDETPPADYRERCSKNVTGWTREAAARLEAERKVG